VAVEDVRCDVSAPDSYVEWINTHLGFNPRSQANSNVLSDFVVTDLQKLCPEIAAHLKSDEIVPNKNADVRTKVASRNVDLVLNEQNAGRVRVAVEHKTIMTAHGKARWNRYGDIIAYCNHMHNHRRESIASATVIINCSPAYENPDGFAKGLVRPRFDMRKIVTDTAKIFADIPLRNVPEEPNDQPEALAVIVVDYDGQNPAKLVIGDLAPQMGSPIHYDSFLARICNLYRQRFAVV
jgi:hypothetical protein